MTDEPQPPEPDRQTSVDSAEPSSHSSSTAALEEADTEWSYAEGLLPEHHAAYESADANLDLEQEIRLLRLVLVLLAGDVPENHAHIVRALGTLDKLMRTQAGEFGRPTDLERELQAAGEAALQELAETKRELDRPVAGEEETGEE